MQKLNKAAWFEQGFNILKTSGAADLTIENLTKSLNKTKGSFYHHFKNRDDFFKKILEFWEAKQTFDIIQIQKQEKTFKSINATLLKLSKENMDPDVEVAIRAWALRDPLVRIFQKRIDNQRMGFLQAMFSLMTDDHEQVEMISLIRYCFYIGSHQIIPAIDEQTYKKKLDALMGMFETYIELNKSKKNYEGIMEK
ncbi:MAG: TetR/AcrR family transcriptional regulator [Desulfobacula sp.]|uniref:TetR/AcrR family transcriptional regulator n=1 Tax=Desulfobacula sp. TaxID=2593537 RepID=UPI0025BE691C|nr:TetR/AcrR family transcriptional regulator [Desulfobacula sp.]MCD4721482.1 TetR/AcrR family transcriptional regulator [Desulfobacula sp.]